MSSGCLTARGPQVHVARAKSATSSALERWAGELGVAVPTSRRAVERWG